MNLQSRFEQACIKGEIEEVKQIIKEEEFQTQPSISYSYSTGVYQAADRNHLKLLRFLLEESDLKHHVSINFENNCILKTAARQEYYDIVNYLIMEYDMNITTDILMPNYQNSDYVADLYNKRVLRKTLNVELNAEEKTEKKKLKL